jgi:hypothetical protein
MIAAIAFAVFLSTASADEGASAQQERGRTIYQTGRSGSGQPIMATLGNGGDAIDASLLPCSQCHSDDGRGRAEGGVQPADIRPQTLARELALPARARPAYTRAQRVRAITLGVDAGGNALDRAMPRFQLTQADAQDLLAYLDVLGSVEPGISDTTIVIDVVGAADFSAPVDAIYGRHVVLQHDDRRGAFLTIDVSDDGTASVKAAANDGIPTLALASQRAPGNSAFVIGASSENLRAGLRQYAQDSGAKTLIFPSNCDELKQAPHGALVLMLLAEARPCHLDRVPVVDTRTSYVFASATSTQRSGALAAAVLSVVMQALAELGRDVHRDGMIAALQKSPRPAVGPLPPIAWRAGQHLGSPVAWLAQMDLANHAVLPRPGWVSVPAHPTTP